MATANLTAESVKSKTEMAVEYMNAHGVTAYAAAKEIGVGVDSVYRFIKRYGIEPRCPCCHQLKKAEA